jgi:hypothetical protein
MPLSEPVVRHEIHHRVIDMRAYRRSDGLYDVEAHLVDTKPFDLTRISAPEPLPAGQALHDLWIRLTIDHEYIVRHIEAASDATPFGMCKEAESTLSVLVGERVASGWSRRVKEKLRGTASCTHLMEMLIPMGTTAMQGIRALAAGRPAPLDANGAPQQLDSCYAFSRHREVVKRLWPLHYQPNI